MDFYVHVDKHGAWQILVNKHCTYDYDDAYKPRDILSLFRLVEASAYERLCKVPNIFVHVDTRG